MAAPNKENARSDIDAIADLNRGIARGNHNLMANEGLPAHGTGPEDHIFTDDTIRADGSTSTPASPT